MSNYFEFTQVKAPDISAAASFMRNAQNSFADAAEAVTAGANLVRTANIEKDTRIRNDNTAHWANRISSAQSLEEVDALRRELSSDEFRSQYENDLYIDTNQLVEALDARPAAIETRQRIDEGLRSSEQEDVVSAALLAVSGARSTGELDALVRDVQTKNLTVGNAAKIAQAVDAQRSHLQTKRTNDLNYQINAKSLQDAQKREQYNKELVNLSKVELEKLLSGENTTDADIERTVDALTTKLVNKYGFDPTVVEASVNNLVSASYTQRLDSGTKSIVNAMSPDIKSEYLTGITQLSSQNGDELYVQQSANIARIQFPAVANQFNTQPASVDDINKVLDALQKNDVDTSAFKDLPASIKTQDTISILRSATSTADFKLMVNQLSLEDGLYRQFQIDMSQSQNAFRTSYDTQRNQYLADMNSNIKAQARLKERMAEAQQRGEDVTSLKSELAKLTDIFETTNSKVQEFIKTPPNAAKDWAKTDKGIDSMVKAITKQVKRDKSPESIDVALRTLKNTYNITDDQMSSLDNLRQYLPEPVANLTWQLNKDLVKSLDGADTTNRSQMVNDAILRMSRGTGGVSR